MSVFEVREHRKLFCFILIPVQMGSLNWNEYTPVWSLLMTKIPGENSCFAWLADAAVRKNNEIKTNKICSSLKFLIYKWFTVQWRKSKLVTVESWSFDNAIYSIDLTDCIARTYSVVLLLQTPLLMQIHNHLCKFIRNSWNKMLQESTIISLNYLLQVLVKWS